MQIESLEERVRRLERAVRRANLALMGVGLIVAVCVAGWALATATNRAQAQSITGMQGILRGVVLRLHDADGVDRVMLGTYSGGPKLWLCDEDGTARVMLGMTDSGPRLSLRDASGKEIWHAPDDGVERPAEPKTWWTPWAPWTSGLR
jgi:hypothetical protein